MNNVYELPKRKVMLGEASEWIARLDRGMTKQEEKAMQIWLAENSKNPETLMKLAMLWDRMDSLSYLFEQFPESKNRQTRSRRIPLVLAASVLLAVLVGLWSAFGISPAGFIQQPSVTGASNETVFETGIGEQSSIKLPDGSELILNTNSQIRTRFSSTQRALVLERGEVHVRVAHDRKRPFNVYVGDEIVQAVGTEFNLEITSEQRIELIVTEGKVFVGLRDGMVTSDVLTERKNPSQTLPDSSRILGAGELLVLGGASEEIERLEPEEIEVKLSWRGGNLIFRGESLAAAIAEIERYTPVEFVIQDEDLKKVRVAGLFKAGDVDGLLTTLKENFNVAYTRVSEEKIILSNK